MLPRSISISLMAALLLLTACVRSAPDTTGEPVPDYVPALPPVITTFPTMTKAPPTPSFFLLPTRIPGSPILTPTPDSAHFLPAAQVGPETYVVQPGDTVGTIARSFGLSDALLISANGLIDPNVLNVGQVLTIPHPTPIALGSSFKVIPDSELVYGPMAITLDVEQFILAHGGYLAGYTGEADGQMLTGAQIVKRVAQDYSVNPRLLLALLEYRSGWVTNPAPNESTLDNPIGYIDAWHAGLYRQLAWSANMLNRGYYLWRVNGIADWTLVDGTVVPAATDINSGTAAVQSVFSSLDDVTSWQYDVSESGLFATYNRLFGYPFDLAIEPIVPANLIQPPLQLPFESGVVWAFTGGPHGGWDTGSAWAAIDFSPAGTEGCVLAQAWVVAAADGLVVRSENGEVVQDLDGDGYEQTGWTILYLHVETRERVTSGTYLHAGQRIGHPSCEGGIADATHLHLARRFNGEWIPADGTVPFNLDGWISTGTGQEYDGFLVRGSRSVEAFNGNGPINQITR